MAKLSVGHVAVVPDDLTDMLWGHVLLLSIHKTKLSLLRVALCLQLLPFSCYRFGEYTIKKISRVMQKRLNISAFNCIIANIPFSCSFSSVM